MDTSVAGVIDGVIDGEGTTVPMGSDGGELGGGESMTTVCATGVGPCAAGTGVGGRGRRDGDGDGDGANAGGDTDGGAIVTTALGFDAAIAAIARGFVNGMTLGATVG